jgi:hypothetical protein
MDKKQQKMEKRNNKRKDDKARGQDHVLEEGRNFVYAMLQRSLTDYKNHMTSPERATTNRMMMEQTMSDGSFMRPYNTCQFITKKNQQCRSKRHCS